MSVVTVCRCKQGGTLLVKIAVQEYLTYKKTLPPRTLLKACVFICRTLVGPRGFPLGP